MAKNGLIGFSRGSETQSVVIIKLPHFFSFYFEAFRKIIIINSSEFRPFNCITQHIILIYRLNVPDMCPIHYLLLISIFNQWLCLVVLLFLYKMVCPLVNNFIMRRIKSAVQCVTMIYNILFRYWPCFCKVKTISNITW